MSPARRLLAEFLGTALLLFVIVGSGINAERMSSDGTVTLLAHAVAVGAGLAALIAFLGPVSGAHFNPSVTVGFWLTDAIAIGAAAGYVVMQLAGALVGTVAANLTFDVDAVAVSDTSRSGAGLVGAEFIATFVLVLLILGLVRTGHIAAVAPAVGAWVTAIVLATASTGFANPAVTVARIFTETYTGVAPANAFGFVIAQLTAGIVAAWAAFFFFPEHARATDVSQEAPP